MAPQIATIRQSPSSKDGTWLRKPQSRKVWITLLRFAMATAGPARPSIIAMLSHSTPVPARAPARIPKIMYKVGKSAYPPPLRVITNPMIPPMRPSVMRKIELAEIPSMPSLIPMYFRISPLTPKHTVAIIAKNDCWILTKEN